MFSKQAYNLNVCSGERDSEIIIIPRNELTKCFSDAEIDKIRTQTLVEFPNE